MALAARTPKQLGSARAPALLVGIALVAGLALMPAAAAVGAEPSPVEPAAAAWAHEPAAAAPSAVEAGPTALPPPVRLAGADRYATAVAISRRSFPWRASVVFLASGTRFPDGLSAGPAAVHLGGPVLRTPRDRVPQLVLDEIRRLDLDQLVIVGGTPSV